MISQEMEWGKIYDGGDAHKIIENLYNEQNYKELHIALWTWLSLDGTKDKWEWFDTFGIPEVVNHCFACKVAETAYFCLPKWERKRLADEDWPPFCHCCPIIDKPFGECLDGLYGKWLETYLEEREDVAMEIASLEWQYK